MKRFAIMLPTIVFLFAFANTEAQLTTGVFKTKDRLENRAATDEIKFSWGFFIGGNNFGYKLVLDDKYGIDQNRKDLVTAKSKYGFGAGLIGKMRINKHLDLRLEPGLQFIERELSFDTQNNSLYAADPNNPFTPIELTDADKLRNLKSTYLDIPLMLEFHGDRWYNSRPYAAAGFNYMVNLQSNSDNRDDNQQGQFRSTTHNFGLSAELGIQFYFSRVKITPAVRGTFVLNNEIVADNAGTPPYWASAINTMRTRAFLFVLKFE